MLDLHCTAMRVDPLGSILMVGASSEKSGCPSRRAV